MNLDIEAKRWAWPRIPANLPQLFVAMWASRRADRYQTLKYAYSVSAQEWQHCDGVLSEPMKTLAVTRASAIEQVREIVVRSAPRDVGIDMPQSEGSSKT